MRLRRTTGTAASDPGATRPARRVESSAPTLIGADGLATPPWAKVYEAMAGSGTRRMLRAAPAALVVLVRLAWQTSPRLTLLAAAVELAAGCATAFGLLATATVLTQLLEQGPTPQRVVAALPRWRW